MAQQLAQVTAKINVMFYVLNPFHNVMLCYFAILFCYVIVMLGRDEGPLHKAVVIGGQKSGR